MNAQQFEAIKAAARRNEEVPWESLTPKQAQEIAELIRRSGVKWHDGELAAARCKYMEGTQPK